MHNRLTSVRFPRLTQACPNILLSTNFLPDMFIQLLSSLMHQSPEKSVPSTIMEFSSRVVGSMPSIATTNMQQEALLAYIPCIFCSGWISVHFALVSLHAQILKSNWECFSLMSCQFVHTVFHKCAPCGHSWETTFLHWMKNLLSWYRDAPIHYFRY